MSDRLGPESSGDSGDVHAVDWASHPRNPIAWPQWKKWMTMATACWVTFIVGLNATSITTAADVLTEEFNLQTGGDLEVNFFAVTAWNAAAATVPLVTLPLMDTYGVRYGYLMAYILFTVFLIPQALARNFATLVVCRAIAGAFGGTLQNAADGIAANLFMHHHERVLPLTGYVATLLLGVTMGPVLGAVVEPLGWRWIIWIQLIVCGACIPLVVFCMRETRGPVLKAKHHGSDASTTATADSSAAMNELYLTVTRSAVLLTTEPTVTFFTLWSSFAFGLVFISTQSIPLVFGNTFNWQTYSGGLVQVSIAIGQIIGFGACLVQKEIYVKSVKRNSEKPGTPVPEAILHLSIPSTIILTGGLFMYGWSIYQPHWIVTAVGLALTGFASIVIVNAASIYVTDAYSNYAASAIAAVAFGENAGV
ncbi:hypothetical protein K4F52_004346 [Lecanicillium sp. MT-2017a]|nr:hypothetical protein K4F52_004346 [Lecanicillium sp. MT-2017a]